MPKTLIIIHPQWNNIFTFIWCAKRSNIRHAHTDRHRERERERELWGSWVQESCMWNSWSRVRGSEPVASRRAGSCIHSWYLGTCASMYGTIITFFPSKLTLFFSIFCSLPRFFAARSKSFDLSHRHRTPRRRLVSVVPSFKWTTAPFLAFLIFSLTQNDIPFFTYSKVQLAPFLTYGC